VGESNTVYEVKLSMPESENVIKYRIDMTADAIFVIKEKNDVLAIPTVTIMNEGSKKYVYRKKNNSKEKVIIETGTEFDNDTEIISGLSEGDLIYD
jgi:multidrug efflux pump subunit AcrA (membrane-fusion protein)